MSDDDDDVFSDDDDLLRALEEKRAVNRQINETRQRHAIALQRTLTGERLDPNAQTHYEEIRRDVTYHPTHHQMDKALLKRYIYPTNLETRDYQFDIIKKALFKNLLCAIPTGMGKTFIASTVMLNYYRWFPRGKIIFMAPTRPLVAQQIQACLGCTDILSSDTAILLDKMRKNRPEIWNTKRVFFTTPQVVENDLKRGALDPKEIVCLVIDEAHRATGGYAYTNVVEFIDRFNTSFRVLALTATPAADIEGVQTIVNNLDISTIEIRTEESIDIVKYMKKKETVRINVGINSEMYEIIEMLSTAIDPILKEANEANIYDITDPARINFFAAHQKCVALMLNRDMHEGMKWKYYFILQIIGRVGQMLRRLKIYGIKTFYSYFQNQYKEFRSKYEVGKSKDRTASIFYYHESLREIHSICGGYIKNPALVTHPKLEKMQIELLDFFDEKPTSRVIVFTELRESALEIVQFLSRTIGDKCKPHIFIGQSKAKEPFDEEEFKLKNTKKGKGKANKEAYLEKVQALELEKERKKKEEAERRAASRTGTSEEAQAQGMTQKMQKEVIKKFKEGTYNVIVATSIGEEGLDIGEVDLIICYDSTSSPIKNIQRMGRTGRKNDGKVILLLAGSEELKFDQAMDNYARVQHQIASNELELKKSDRIIPANITPLCSKEFIDIPEENKLIAKGQDNDEVIKYATQAMLGNLPKATKKRSASVEGGVPRATKKKKGSDIAETLTSNKKRFFMPDNVETGFVQSSKLVKKVDVKGQSIERKQSNDSHSMSIDLTSDDSDLEVTKENDILTANTTHRSVSFNDNSNLSISGADNKSTSQFKPTTNQSQNDKRISSGDILKDLMNSDDGEDEIPVPKGSRGLSSGKEDQGLTKEELTELEELDGMNLNLKSPMNSQHITRSSAVIPDSEDEEIDSGDKLTKEEIKELDDLDVDVVMSKYATKLLDFGSHTESEPHHREPPSREITPVISNRTLSELDLEFDNLSDPNEEEEKPKPSVVPNRPNSRLYFDFDALSDCSYEIEEEIEKPQQPVAPNGTSSKIDIDNTKTVSEEDQVSASEEEEEEDNFFKDVMVAYTQLKKNTQTNSEEHETNNTQGSPDQSSTVTDTRDSNEKKDSASIEKSHVLIDSLIRVNLIDFSQYEDNDTNDSQIEKAQVANENKYQKDETFHYDDELADLSNSKNTHNITPVRVKEKIVTANDSLKKSRMVLETPKSSGYSSKVDITSLLKECTKPRKHMSLRSRRVDFSDVPASQIINVDEDIDQLLQDPTNGVIVNLEEEQKLIKEPFKYMSQQDQAFPIIFLEEDGFMSQNERMEFFSKYYTTAEIGLIVPNPSFHIRKSREFTGNVKHSGVASRFINFTSMTGSKEGIRLNRMAQKLKSISTIELYDDSMNSKDIIVDENEVPITADGLSVKERIDLMSQSHNNIGQPQVSQRYNSYDFDEDFVECSSDDADYRFL